MTNLGENGVKSPRGRGEDVAKAHASNKRGEMFGMYPARPARAEASDAGLPQGQTRETILLVEDEPAVRQLFAQALTRAGYRVYEARNGQEAIKVFDQYSDAIDLLLTDMRMPYMGGAELAQHLRARSLTLKLLCISGYPGGDAKDLGADFLAKPFSRDDLLAKVREVLDRK
jgi:CheY-like chemotaxis protein